MHCKAVQVEWLACHHRHTATSAAAPLSLLPSSGGCGGVERQLLVKGLNMGCSFKLPPHGWLLQLAVNGPKRCMEEGERGECRVSGLE
jgi:hypothetical protein